MTYPGIKAKWNISVSDVGPQTEALVQDSIALYDKIGNIPTNKVSHENIVKALNDFEAETGWKESLLTTLHHISPNKEIREASVEADKKLSELNVKLSMRKDVFDNFVALEAKGTSDWSDEYKRFLSRLIRDGRRNGLHLDNEARKEIEAIKKRITALCIEFENNLNNENTSLEFSADELKGLSEDFIGSLDKTKDSGKYKVSLKYPHYIPFMKKARNAESRRRLEQAFTSRCMEENTKILQEVVELRHKKAKILGFPTHAAFILDIRMAKTPDQVETFLMELSKKLRPLQDEEMKLFLSYKEKECKEDGREFDGKIHYHELTYYKNMSEEIKYAVDHEKLRNYFPLDTVLKGSFDIYQRLLGLQFKKVENPESWHESVSLWETRDAKTGDLKGYFYLDLFPREGKYSHAAKFEIQPGCQEPNGSYQVPVAAMVANFTEKTADKPSLLTFNEVETFFHEFGHVMHQLCTKATISMFSGTRVERDFVEAPSQMLENWCWQKESLTMMSGHYDNGESIPSSLLESLLQSRTANAGVFNLRQIALGMFDQRLHSNEKVDVLAEYTKAAEEFMKISPSPNTNMAASFGHLCGGYDASYYGYMWSEVFSADMFYSKFDKDHGGGGVLSPEMGMHYRRSILEPGGTKDGDVLLMDFLGRKPQQEAFLKSKGLAT